VVPSDRSRGSGHTLKYRRFHGNCRKHFFSVRVTQHWYSLFREVLEFPSVELLKSHLYTVLDNWL